jgi:flagellar biosynthetic protein FliQ
MDGIDVVDVAREAIWVTLQLSGPLLLVALLVGLVISLVQALTQIQEMTLTFIPKMAAILATLFLLLPFFGTVMQRFSTYMFDKIVTIEEKERHLPVLASLP